MISPIFHDIANLKGAEIRVYMPSVTPTNPSGISAAMPVGSSLGLKVRVDNLTVADYGASVKDIETAENTILAIPSVANHQVTWVGLDDADKASTAKLIFGQAMKYSGYIASCSRRGPANTILMGSNVYATLANALAETSGILEFIEEETVGRWTKKANYLGDSKIGIYVCDDFAANDIVVLYTSSSAVIDGPGGLIRDANGDIHLRVLPNNPTALGNASDFIRRFHVDFK